MTKESDSKKKSIDIPDVTTTFQSVALLEASGHAAVQEHEIQKRESCTIFSRTLSFFCPVFGIAIVMAGCFTFASCHVIIKLIVDVDPFHFALVRATTFTILASPIVAALKKDPFPKGHRMKLVARACLGSSGVLIHFYGLKHMPQGDVSMLTAGAPALTAIFAFFILKEKIILLDILNVVIVLAGMLLIIKPPFIFGYSEEYEADPEYAIAAIGVSCCTFIQANVYILLRLLKEVHFAVIILVFGIVGTVVSTVALFAFSTPHIPESNSDIVMTFAVGFLSFLAQIALTQATKLLEASKASLMQKSCGIVFAFTFQIIVFHDIPGLYSIMGAMLISFVVILSGFKKIVDSLPADHWIKKRFLESCYGDDEVTQDHQQQDGDTLLQKVATEK